MKWIGTFADAEVPSRSRPPHTESSAADGSRLDPLDKELTLSVMTEQVPRCNLQAII